MRYSVAREHSSRAIRLSTSIGVRRFARMEWSWKMRGNLSNDCSSVRGADADLEIRLDRRLRLAARLAATFELSDHRRRHTAPHDPDIALDQRLEQPPRDFLLGYRSPGSLLA